MVLRIRKGRKIAPLPVIPEDVKFEFEGPKSSWEEKTITNPKKERIKQTKLEKLRMLKSARVELASLLQMEDACVRRWFPVEIFRDTMIVALVLSLFVSPI
mmetsp:Transcript_8307/g.13477  ORF Transcript_8307/g.13477 Transcript_8307/m.13477 type:complete len:101 (-) Transcript_8307:1328-1630(-)